MTASMDRDRVAALVLGCIAEADAAYACGHVATRREMYARIAARSAEQLARRPVPGLDAEDIAALLWMRTFVDDRTELHDGSAGRALGLTAAAELADRHAALVAKMKRIDEGERRVLADYDEVAAERDAARAECGRLRSRPESDDYVEGWNAALAAAGTNDVVRRERDLISALRAIADNDDLTAGEVRARLRERIAGTVTP